MGGKLVMKSDTPAYKPFVVNWRNGRDDQFKIISLGGWVRLGLERDGVIFAGRTGK